MNLKSLKILSQNVHKNTLIIQTLLETQKDYDIILIQESPWSEIWKVLSPSNSEGDPLISTSHHPNWIMFGRTPVDSNNSLRVISYVNIHLLPLWFLLRKDIINHKDINLISFFNNNMYFFIMNVYSDSSHTALKYLKNTEVNIDNVLIMTGDFNIRDRLWDPTFPHHSTISDELFIIANSFNLFFVVATTRHSRTNDLTTSKALSRLSSNEWGITRELDKEPSLHCSSIYISYKWSMLQQCVYLMSIHHASPLRPPCFLHVPWRHTFNLRYTCAHHVYTMRNPCPLMSSPNPNSDLDSSWSF